MSKSSRWARLGRLSKPQILIRWARLGRLSKPQILIARLVSYKSLKTLQFFNIFTSWASLAGSRSLWELIWSLLSSSGSFREVILSLWEFIFKLWELPGAHFQAPGASGSLFLSHYATKPRSL